MAKVQWHERELRVAIIGGGPSGFFAADALLGLDVAVRVDLFERLPLPYGLIRYGISPDHPRTKSIIAKFNKLSENTMFNFIGNVCLGKDITYLELREFYDVIVFSYGADIPRKTGIKNEDVGGVHAAIKFVNWYNGHPEYADSKFNLDHEDAVVIGNGNVALDVARILVRDVNELRETDITQNALDVLSASKIQNVHIIGRRGPLQSSFSFKDLKEISELAQCKVIVNPDDLILNQASLDELNDTQSTYRRLNYSLFEKAVANTQDHINRNIIFHFLRSPIEVIGDAAVSGIILEKNELTGSAESQKAIGTRQFEELKCGLMLTSIGYTGSKVSDVPYDEVRGVIANIDGRVVDGDNVVSGNYAIGWIQRGSTGLLGTNKRDSTRFVKFLLEDLDQIIPCNKPDTNNVLDLLQKRCVKTVSFSDWLKLDAIELSRGEALSKPREKLSNIDEIFENLAKS